MRHALNVFALLSLGIFLILLYAAYCAFDFEADFTKVTRANAFNPLPDSFLRSIRESPFADLLVIASILPLVWPTDTLVRRFVPSELPPGHCPACGYDLRASPKRCPECGRMVDSSDTVNEN